MSTVETVLVVFLGLALLVFLVLAIVVVVITIKVLRSVKRITLRAEETTASFADIATMVGKRVAPVALSAAVAAAMRRIKSNKE